MTQPAIETPAQRDGGGVSFIRAHLDVVPLPTRDADIESRVKALPWGEVNLRDAEIRKFFGEPGALLVDERTVAEVPVNFAERDIDYYVNVNHGYSEAMGWIRGVDVVANDGLYIDIDWTETGKQKLKDRAYRYGSIEVIVARADEDKPAPVVAVTGFALTNNPAVVGMVPVAAETMQQALSGFDGRVREGQSDSRDTGRNGETQMSENIWKKLFSRVSGEEVDDEVEAVEKASDLRIQLDQTVELEQKLEEERARADELAARLIKLEEELEEQAEAVMKSEIEAAVAAALESGKLAPSMKDWALDLAEADRDALETFLAAVEDGKFKAPEGRLVPDGVINSPDTTGLAAEAIRDAIDDEVKAIAKENSISYGDAYELYTKTRKGA